MGGGTCNGTSRKMAATAAGKGNHTILNGQGWIQRSNLLHKNRSMKQLNWSLKNQLHFCNLQTGCEPNCLVFEHPQMLVWEKIATAVEMLGLCSYVFAVLNGTEILATALVGTTPSRRTITAKVIMLLQWEHWNKRYEMQVTMNYIRHRIKQEIGLLNNVTGTLVPSSGYYHTIQFRNLPQYLLHHPNVISFFCEYTSQTPILFVLTLIF